MSERSGQKTKTVWHRIGGDPATGRGVAFRREVVRVTPPEQSQKLVLKQKPLGRTGNNNASIVADALEATKDRAEKIGEELTKKD